MIDDLPLFLALLLTVLYTCRMSLGSHRKLVESYVQFVNVICKAGSLAVWCTDMGSKGTVRSPVDLGSEDSFLMESSEVMLCSHV